MKSLILHIALIFVPPLIPQDAPMSLREACSWTSGMPMTTEEAHEYLAKMERIARLHK